MLPMTAPATFGALVLTALLAASAFPAAEELLDIDEVTLRPPATKPGRLALDMLLLECKSGIVDVDKVVGGTAKGVIWGVPILWVSLYVYYFHVMQKSSHLFDQIIDKNITHRNSSPELEI
jgi:hypothetical protein